MPRKVSKLSGRWQEASQELEDAKAKTPTDSRFSLDKAEEDINLPSYLELIPPDAPNSQYMIQTAPTSNGERPRALTIGYNPNTSTLVVVFRDNTWWQYNDVPPDLWEGLRNSESTGVYLRESGLDFWPSMGPANLEDLTEGTKAQITQNAQLAEDIQNGDQAIEQASEGMLNLRGFTAEELFRDKL